KCQGPEGLLMHARALPGTVCKGRSGCSIESYEQIEREDTWHAQSGLLFMLCEPLRSLRLGRDFCVKSVYRREAENAEVAETGIPLEGFRSSSRATGSTQASHHLRVNIMPIAKCMLSYRPRRLKSVPARLRTA